MNPTQLSLDAPVRSSDPDTSVDAAVSVEWSAANDRGMVLDALNGHGGRGTADQITGWLNEVSSGRVWQRNCVSSRCSQLVRRGLICDSGERGMGATGRPVIVFEVTR